MALFFNFSTPKPRKFQYRPMYYDERKERLEKMRAEAEAAAKRGEVRYSGLNRGFLFERRNNSKMKHTVLEKMSSLRFIIILLILLGILYFFMPELFSAFWKAKN